MLQVNMQDFSYTGMASRGRFFIHHTGNTGPGGGEGFFMRSPEEEEDDRTLCSGPQAFDKLVSDMKVIKR
jgi:hypothetical protein